MIPWLRPSRPLLLKNPTAQVWLFLTKSWISLRESFPNPASSSSSGINPWHRGGEDRAGPSCSPVGSFASMKKRWNCYPEFPELGKVQANLSPSPFHFPCPIFQRKSLCRQVVSRLITVTREKLRIPWSRVTSCLTEQERRTQEGESQDSKAHPAAVFWG